MNKKFTKLIAALALLVFMTPSMVAWGQTTVASYSRSGTTNTITGGEFTATFSAKTGYYQDNSGDCYMQILSTDAYWTTTPTSISFAASIGGGTGNKDLTNPVYVSLLDANGDVITNTQTTVTSHITTNTGDSYEITMPVVNNVYGVKLSHEKETGYNVRYYSFSLSYVANGGSTPPTPTTYTVTFDAGEGTFQGNNDFPNTTNSKEAGTYTLPSANRDGYTFDGWTITGDANLYTGSYEVSGDVDFTAHYTENTPPTPGGDLNLTFDVSSNPGGWPTTNSTTLTSYTYTLNSVDYTFALKNVKCNSGYLMMTQVAVLGLPAIEGYKLTKVVASNSSGCSISTKVGISSSDSQASYISGGEVQTWSATSSQYTYTLTSTNANTMYYMYVTNKNAQVITLALTYAQVSTSEPSISGTAPAELGYTASSGSFTYTLDAQGTTGTVSATVPSGSWISSLVANSGTVTFDYAENPNAAQRSETVTLSYAYGGSAPATATVTVTQAGNPNIVDNISDITGADDYHVKGMVVATSSRGFIIGDGTGFVYTYLNAAPSYSVGDNLSITGTTSTSYGHVIQFTDAATIETVTSTNYNGDPQPEVITAVPDYSTGNHLSTYLQFEGTLSKTINGNYTNYNIAVGEGTIRISYPTDGQITELDALENKTVRVHGFFAGISGTTFTALMESVEEVISTEPSVTVNPSTINAPFGGANGTVDITYENISGLTDFDYHFCDAEGNELLDTDPAYPDWIDAAINVNNNDEYSLDYEIYANDGDARTAYIYVFYETYYAIVTVNQAAYVVDYATLPFDWTSTFGTMPTGVTNSGVSTDNNGTYLKFDTDGDNITLKINERPGTLSYDVKGNPSNNVWEGTLTVETSANGTDWSTLAAHNDLSTSAYEPKSYDLGETVRYIRWTYSKTTGNAAMKNIHVTEYVDPSTVPSIDASDVNLAYDDTNDYIVYEIDNYVDGTMSANTEATWISDIVVTPDPSDASVGEVTFSVTANNSTNSRSATVTLTYTYNTNQTVTKDVTVTQAGKPAVIIASPVQLTAAANDNGTIDVTYANFTPYIAGDPVLYVDANCETEFTGNWILVGFAKDSGNNDDYNHITYVVDANNGAARTVYMKVEVMDENNLEVSTVVTITQAAYSAPGTWVLTDFADLTPADVFVITGTNDLGTTYYALPNNGGAHKPSVTVVNVNSSTNTLENSPETTLQWNLVITEDGYVFYPAGQTDSWLYCLDDVNDGVRIGTGNNKHFTMDDTYNYLTTTETTYQRYIGIYNSTDWRCYKLGNGNSFPTNIAGQTFHFFKKVSDEVTCNKTIENYYDAFDQTVNPNGDYYLIASPVASVTPTEVNGFLTTGGNNYDFYYFDQSEDAEWRNYKQATFDLVSGKGYLYASKNGTILTFKGQPYNGNGLVVLKYDATANFAGWNLVGNPFAVDAYLADTTGTGMAFYRMNSDGNGFEAVAAGTIASMEGIFVKASAANQTIRFTTTAPSTNGNNGNLNINVAQVVTSRGASASSDNAIVRFDGGNTLEKFSFRDDNAKLYIPQDGKDYAVVSAENAGELPVNFKAAAEGKYTISVDAENLDLNYLHLIDNKAGMDVDLLATPSYSFEARTTDYASRFRLVFSANNGSNENGNETFAYYNGSEWVISNMGEATLQVVDVMGRVLSSETVSGNANVSLNQTPGVYMLRLINSDSVKTQKIVVR